MTIPEILKGKDLERFVIDGPAITPAYPRESNGRRRRLQELSNLTFIAPAALAFSKVNLPKGHHKRFAFIRHSTSLHDKPVDPAASHHPHLAKGRR